MDKITIERETLLPCPFCGSGASITGTEWGGREQYFVACTGPDCHCAVGENYDRDACPEYSFSSKDDAIAAWNRRAALAAQPAEPAYTHADVAEAHAKGYALGLRQVDRPQPAGAQQEPNMRHPKIQALIGKNARQHIWMMLVEQLVEDPHFETTAMDMEYWDTLHDKLKEKLTAAPPAPAAVPPGYALVPIEPTPKMVAAYLNANDEYWKRADELPPSLFKWRNGTPKDATVESYRAMIAAAGDKT